MLGTPFRSALKIPSRALTCCAKVKRFQTFLIRSWKKSPPHATDMVDQGLSGATINVPYLLASEMGNFLCRTKNKDFAFTWFLRTDGQIQGSWRSEKMDILHLAEKFGGGGHPRACGARMSMTDLLGYINQKPSFRAKSNNSCCY